MKIAKLILFLLIYNNCFSQIDTVKVDLADMSINFKTCECTLFGNCRTYSYPIPKDWKRADSLFIGNIDTIYFVLKDHGKTKIEGYKLPDREAFGKILFYNKASEIIKIEFWQDYSLQQENNNVSFGDAPYWKKQLIYRNSKLIKETTKSIYRLKEKEFVHRIEVKYYKKEVLKRTKIKTNTIG
jgi:hypothetical protein